jgi:hypothetical protein
MRKAFRLIVDLYDSLDLHMLEDSWMGRACVVRVKTCAAWHVGAEGSAIGPGGRLDLASSSRATLGRRRAFTWYISRQGPVDGFSPCPVVHWQTSQLLFHLWLSSFGFLFSVFISFPSSPVCFAAGSFNMQMFAGVLLWVKCSDLLSPSEDSATP